MTTAIDRNHPTTPPNVRDDPAATPNHHDATPVAGEAMSEVANDPLPTIADWCRAHAACEWASMGWPGETSEQLTVAIDAIVRRHVADASSQEFDDAVAAAVSGGMEMLLYAARRESPFAPMLADVCVAAAFAPEVAAALDRANSGELKRDAAALRRVVPHLAAEARVRVAVAPPDEISEVLATCESATVRELIVTALHERSNGPSAYQR